MERRNKEVLREKGKEGKEKGQTWNSLKCLKMWGFWRQAYKGLEMECTRQPKNKLEHIDSLDSQTR